MKTYYIYAYCDPRKPVDVDCEGIHFDFEPFYIGKGTGDRKRHHRWPSYLKKGSDNFHKSGRIKKILEEGLEPIILSLFEGEEDACFQKEEQLISKIGRSDLGTGPLTNLVAGGLGGKSPSEETREKLRKRPNNFKGKHHSEETKRYLSELAKGKTPWNKGKGEYLTVEARERTKQGQREWLDAGNRASFSEEVRERFSQSKLGANNPRAKTWHVTNTVTKEEWVFKGGLGRFFEEHGTTCSKVKHSEREIWLYKEVRENDDDKRKIC